MSHHPLSNAEYLNALIRIRGIVASQPLVAEDSTETGNKYTECSWGLCTEPKEAWIKDDMRWPEQYPGRIAPRPLANHQSCPIDSRQQGKVGEFRNGCFFTCRVFQAKRNPPTREQVLEWFDTKIIEWKARLGT